jgi:hypothetical protein
MRTPMNRHWLTAAYSTTFEIKQFVDSLRAEPDAFGTAAPRLWRADKDQ